MTTTAAIYVRISRDTEGEALGVQRQEEDCRVLAEREGLDVLRVYRDNDIGASTLSRKRRPQYEAMVDAARAGEFSTIVAYSNSRLTRRLRELLDLIELYNDHDVRIVTVVSGSDDLSTADGRMTAHIKGSVDQAEAERMGERIRRAHLQRAQNGTTNHGARPFGWQADKVTLDPAEAALIRQAVTEVLDGGGLRSIVRRWNAAGVTTVPRRVRLDDAEWLTDQSGTYVLRGNEWDHRALRQLLKAPRLAGWRVHRGKIATDADGRPVRGVWEPLMDDDTYDRLQVALSGRAGRSPGRRGARRYLLSGVARCGTCGARMYGSKNPSGHAYVCQKQNGPAGSHTVSIAGGPTDERVRAVALARLEQGGPLPNPAPGAAVFEGAERLAEIPGMIAELMAEYNAGRLSGGVVFPQVAKLEAEQVTLSSARDKMIVATAVDARRDVDPERFDSLDLDRQRAILEDLLEAVVIAPTGTGSRASSARTTYVWRQ